MYFNSIFHQNSKTNLKGQFDFVSIVSISISRTKSKDSAQYYYNKLFANLVTESQDPGFLNILYLNYAEHLATVSQINRAINYFELSYKYGISSGINTNKSRTLEKW